MKKLFVFYFIFLIVSNSPDLCAQKNIDGKLIRLSDLPAKSLWKLDMYTDCSSILQISFPDLISIGENERQERFVRTKNIIDVFWNVVENSTEIDKKYNLYLRSDSILLIVDNCAKLACVYKKNDADTVSEEEHQLILGMLNTFFLLKKGGNHYFLNSKINNEESFIAYKINKTLFIVNVTKSNFSFPFDAIFYQKDFDYYQKQKNFIRTEYKWSFPLDKNVVIAPFFHDR